MEIKENDWVFYLGNKAGGTDTGPNYWSYGVIGQVSKIGKGVYLEVKNIQNRKYMVSGSNFLKAFRLCEPHEVPEKYKKESIYEIF